MIGLADRTIITERKNVKVMLAKLVVVIVLTI